MRHDKKIVVVLPAYHAEATLARTYRDIPHAVVDNVLLVDNASTDGTVAIATAFGIRSIVHPSNLGYGGNQKTCYREALAAGGDVVVMLHPDYQFDPRLITRMASMVASGVYDIVLGSRIVGGGALRGGMPRYKYVANRVLTLVQNCLLDGKLSEYHTGYRAFSRRVLESLNLSANSNDFVFDNHCWLKRWPSGFRIGEVSCPTRYFADASSISFRRSMTYGIGVLWTSVVYRLWTWDVVRSRLFEPPVVLPRTNQ